MQQPESHFKFDALALPDTDAARTAAVHAALPAAAGQQAREAAQQALQVCMRVVVLGIPCC